MLKGSYSVDSEGVVTWNDGHTDHTERFTSHERLSEIAKRSQQIQEADWCGRVVEQVVQGYRTKEKMQWDFGDLLVEGVLRFGGNKACDLAVAALEKEGIFVARKTLRDYAVVCRRYRDKASRDARLSFGHHRALMAVRSNDSLAEWREIAVREKLSVEALRAKIKESKKKPMNLVLAHPDSTWMTLRVFLRNQSIEIFRHKAKQENITFDEMCAKILNEHARELWPNAPALAPKPTVDERAVSGRSSKDTFRWYKRT